MSVLSTETRLENALEEVARLQAEVASLRGRVYITPTEILGILRLFHAAYFGGDPALGNALTRAAARLHAKLPKGTQIPEENRWWVP